MISVTRRDLLNGILTVAGVVAFPNITVALASKATPGLDRNKTYQVWHTTEAGKRYVGKFNGVTSYYLPENCFLTEESHASR